MSTSTTPAPATVMAIAAEKLRSSALHQLARNLVLAALIGEEQVQGALAGRATELAQPVDDPEDSTALSFLSAITVEGFRGIGSALTIQFDSGPGLTVIQGGNGSGKSSIAEALELLVTDTLKRWDVKTRKDWREGWRNLHHQGHAAIEAHLVVSGKSDQIALQRTWASDATQEGEGRTRVRSADTGHQVGDSSWVEALRVWKPFMSPAESQSLIDKPADFYDVMRSTLGLDYLFTGQTRLADCRKPLEQRSQRLGKDKSSIVANLRGASDDRAISCLDALQRSPTDLDRIRQIIDGVAAAEPDSISTLRSLAALAVPAADSVADLLAELAKTRLANGEFAGADLARERNTVDLLERALAFHSEHGDDDCPVCGGSPLDSAWRDRTEAAVAELRERTRNIEEADNAFRKAVREAQAIGRFTTSIPLTVVPATIDIERLKTALSAWNDLPPASDAHASALHIETTIGELVEAASDVRLAASRELDAVEADWLPIARNLGTWLADVAQAQEDEPKIAALRAAEQWLKELVDDLIVDRFEPISADVKETFQQLKGLSNVDLQHPRLSGSGNKRGLGLPALIAGAREPKEARALLSQGELTTLGLSLFLPRIRQAACPVGFAIIDDPLQSMDRSKVDGFARALADTSQSRQLIVFTHDARLAEAIQRLRIDATVIEIRRTAKSEVTAERIADPTTRYLKDAKSLLDSGRLPAEARWRVVPNLLRSAIEAAAAAAVMRTRISQGVPHEDVEQAFASALTTRDKLAQAFGIDKKGQGDLDAELRKLTADMPEVIDSLNCLSHPRRAEPPTVKSLLQPVETLIAGLKAIS